MSPKKLLRTALYFSASLSLTSLVACSDDGTDAPGTGGGVGTGGVGTGGAATGGATTGGASTGGSATGGGSTGGASTGGSSTGGASTGGASTGGASTGGTGGDGTGGDGTGGDGTGGDGTGGGSGEFTVTSTAFMDGDPIPSDHTCAGGGGQNNWGEGPPLEWTNVPDGTMSFAFFMIDDTLVPGDVNGYHSGAWNIPTSVTSVPQGFGPTELMTTDSINGAYLGPCPNLITMGNTDTYHLIVLAMPMESYSLTGMGTAGVRDAYDTLSAEALGEAILAGTSDAVMGMP